MIRKYETCRIEYKDCNCFLEYINFKNNLTEYNCLYCNKNYQKKFDESLRKGFVNTYNFSNYDINKFIVLLGKDVYPYEYMDDSEKFNEISLPEKEDFYSYLNMEDITDPDYTHGKRVCEDCKIKFWGEYHNLYVKSNTFL